MIKNNIYILMCLVGMASCGGGGTSTPTTLPLPFNGTAIPPSTSIKAVTTTLKNKLILPDDDGTPVKETWQNLSMLATKLASTPEQSIAQQLNYSGMAPTLMLWPDNTKINGFGRFKEYVNLALATNKFKYVYIYDELFWTPKGDQIGYQEDEILKAAYYAQNNGLKTAVVILPNTILNPEFKLKDMNALDVIGIDIYPSMLVTENTGDCTYNNNVYTTLLYCSQKKLRDMGYQGKVWYVYQAFGLQGEDPVLFKSRLLKQQETIREAERLNIDGIHPWGLYIGKEALSREPYLIQGHDSSFEDMVNF